MPDSRQFKRADVEPCVMCGKGVAHDANLLFYRVRLNRMMLDPNAVQRAHGLEQLFGGGAPGAAIARAIGPDEDLAHTLDSGAEFLVCDPCAMQFPLAALYETMAERAQAESAHADAMARAKLLDEAKYGPCECLGEWGSNPLDGQEFACYHEGDVGCCSSCIFGGNLGTLDPRIVGLPETGNLEPVVVEDAALDSLISDILNPEVDDTPKCICQGFYRPPNCPVHGKHTIK